METTATSLKAPEAAAAMTNHVGRLYSLALALLVFFVLWVGIAAHPWASAGTDPRVAALATREQQLRHDRLIVRRIVAARWTVYRVQLAQRKTAIAAAQQRQNQLNAAAAAVAQAPAGPSSAQSPAVRIVNLPPLTITRTS
jgi:hypothetical protein